MVKYSVITTFHREGYDLYAKKMIQSFDKHWPKDINLYVYHQDEEPIEKSSRIHYFDLHTRCPDLLNFKNKHKDNPLYNGKVMKDGTLNFNANNFKFDAVRFSNKVFCVIDACTTLDSDWVIWLDADTSTFKDIPEDFLSSISPDDCYCTYLGRGTRYHSECGWVGYNIKHPANIEFMSFWKDLYNSGKLFDLREYHDSFVFDCIRRQFEAEGKIKAHDIFGYNGAKGPGHPFINSVLGKYIDHMKGTNRKALGHSLPVDLVNNKTEEYWKKVLNGRE